MAPRSIWNGTITFGLVNVPIKLYTAVESKTVHFREVHAKDGAQIEHRRICPKGDREVGYDDVGKAYEVSPDRYLLERAKEEDIRGRTKMSKKELVDALAERDGS